MRFRDLLNLPALREATPMPIGPGKYDELATIVRETAKARAVLVIVINGSQGSGFSVQGPAELTVALPAMLRLIADKIEADLGGET